MAIKRYYFNSSGMAPQSYCRLIGQKVKPRHRVSS